MKKGNELKHAESDTNLDGNDTPKGFRKGLGVSQTGARTRSYSTNTNLLNSENFQLGSLKSSQNHLNSSQSFSKLHSIGGHLLQDLCTENYGLYDSEKRPSTATATAMKRSISLQSFQEEVAGNTAWVLRFSLDGVYLAAGRQDGIITVWECSSNTHSRKKSEFDIPRAHMPQDTVFNSEAVRIYQGHRHAISDISWSPGAFIVSASLDYTVRLWHISNENCLCIFQHTDFVCSVAFHPFDDGIFASGSFDGRLRVWDIRKKKLLYWNQVQRNSITAICFIEGALQVVVGTLTGTCIFYEFLGLRYSTQININGNKPKSKELKITRIEVMPNTNALEEKILITCADSKIRLMNIKDKSIFRTFKVFESKHVRCCATFSFDGRYIVCPTDDRYISILQVTQDLNQNYSGLLSSVMLRHLDNSKYAGLIRYQASDSPITAAAFFPYSNDSSKSSISSSSNQGAEKVVVANDRGKIYVWDFNVASNG